MFSLEKEQNKQQHGGTADSFDHQPETRSDRTREERVLDDGVTLVGGKKTGRRIINAASIYMNRSVAIDTWHGGWSFSVKQSGSVLFAREKLPNSR